MNTLIFWGSMIFLAFVVVGFVIAKVPGLEHFMKPIVSMLFTAIEALLTNLWAWSIFAIKTLLFSHLELLKHLFLSAESIDPSHAMKEEHKNT